MSAVLLLPFRNVRGDFAEILAVLGKLYLDI